MLFENNDYLDMLFNVNSDNNDCNVSEGFLRGNMFDNEFEPYKNMHYLKPRLNNQREKDLLKVQEIAFEVNDYNLYLDVHPDDMNILNKYKESAERLKRLCKEFEEKYGPLTIDNANYNTFKWIESPWPWQKEDSKYV